jgi:hypothetical protein
LLRRSRLPQFVDEFDRDPTSTLSRLFRRVRARKQLILADLF